MRCDPDVLAEPVNQYAVVSYLPGKLGEFVTSLRRELVDGCVARSHVTILPPRPLSGAPERAEEDLRACSMNFTSFEIEIPSIRIFEATSVIFAEVGRGGDCFSEMHDALNSGVFQFDEPFEYHPHITLAQGFDPATVAERFEFATRRWTERVPRTVAWIENVTFVQNTNLNRWIDLAEVELRGALVI